MDDTGPATVLILGGRSEIGAELACRLAPGAVVILAARGADRLDEQIGAVRAAGAAALVVTAKLEATARLSLDALGLVADAVFGDVHGPQKAVVLSAAGAAIYVGNTPADMAAAVLAGAHPVGVATGSFSAAELRVAGAADVLSSLASFPALYAALAA